MKTLYLILIVTICLCLILFVATFFYIDTHRRTILHYSVFDDGMPVSAVKLDKVNTEDMIVYKSTTSTPFHSAMDRYKRKLSINKKDFTVHGYNKRLVYGKANMNIYIKPVDSSINFLAVGHSNFAYAKRLPVRKGFAIFERDAVISYFNIIDKYDFKKGGTQQIPVLTHKLAFLPPQKGAIDMKLVGEEALDINNKKSKALHFKIRTSQKKEILLWISRWTHVPLKIDIPKDDFIAVLSEVPNEIAAKEYVLPDSDCTSEEVAFNNKDLVLNGTLTLPNGDGPFQAIVMVWGPGPQDRSGYGIFADMAAVFAKEGTAVLRFDKRGIGKSKGNFSRYTSADIIKDVSFAVDFLAAHKKIEPKKIAVLGHSEGGYYAASVAATNPNISACIIMAGIESLNLPDTGLEMLWSFDNSALNWDSEYMQDIAKTARDTSDVLKSGKDWALLLQKRVFLKKSRLDIENNPFEVTRKIKVPLLILRARNDTVISRDHIKSLEDALEEGGNKDFDIIYFSRLNHFFGNIVKDNIHRTHISLDDRIVPAILKWLDEKLVVPPEPEPPPAALPMPELEREAGLIPSPATDSQTLMPEGEQAKDTIDKEGFLEIQAEEILSTQAAASSTAVNIEGTAIKTESAQ